MKLSKTLEETNEKEDTQQCYCEIGSFLNGIGNKYVNTTLISALMMVCCEVSYNHKTVCTNELKKEMKNYLDQMLDFWDQISLKSSCKEKK